MPSDWLNPVLERISNFRHLRKDWDSYGARPPREESIVQAMRLAEHLAEYGTIDRPAIGLVADGKAGLAWDFGDWSLDVTAEPNGEFTWSLLRGNLPDLIGAYDFTRDPGEIAALLGENPGNLS